MFETFADTFKFVCGGKATITLQSMITGKHLTFKIKRSEKFNGKFFVSVLTGNDNENSYDYIGMFDSLSREFNLTKASKYSFDTVSVKAFDYFCKGLKNNQIAKNLIVHHENKCGRCGRKLTTPESIESGFGPECIQKI